MKNKRIVALVLGILCVLFVLITIIISLNRKDDSSEPVKPDNGISASLETGQSGAEVIVPDLSGLTEKEAAALLERNQLKTGAITKQNHDTAEEGAVFAQNPEKDQKCKPGDSVDFTVSLGKKEPENNGSGDHSSQNEGQNNSSPAVSDPDPDPDPVVPASGLNPDPQTKEEIDRVLNDPFMILVNRERRVSSDYSPSNLVYFNSDYELNATAADALKKLVNAGKNAGYDYVLYSGYRSYSSQYNKYYNKISSYESQGKSHDEAVRLTDQYYAPPGGSEHHTGLAADVCTPSIVNQYNCLHENYDQTPEFRWFSKHAHEYGFILRYPQGKEGITGYNYEPWHYRYVGVEVAGEIYRRGITLEEYVEELENKKDS